MLRARKPVRIQVPCAGLEPGSKVSIKIFEPHGLGGDPVDTLQATVSKDGGVAETTWTYDHAKYKDKVTAARFVLLIEGGGRTTISEPLEFVDLLEADLKDEHGHPASSREVVLHPNRGEDMKVATDADGKLRALVPPGDYHISIRGPASDELFAETNLPEQEVTKLYKENLEAFTSKKEAGAGS